MSSPRRPPARSRARRGSTALLALLLVILVPATGTNADDAEVVIRGDLGARIDAAVQRAAGGGIWGAVLVAKDGEVLLAKGYGFADYANRPNRPDTLFEIASTSKQFVGAAIVKLEMEKRLKLSDKITKFFKNVPKEKKDITVRHLLNHTSGVGGDVGLPYATTVSRDQMARHVLEPPLKSRPGEKFAYSNFGYALLAAIVEKASRKSFEAYLEKKLFEPAGMKDTGFIKDEDLDEERVSVRRKEKSSDATAVDWFWGWGYRGMGGVVSTVRDLYRWDRALRGDAVLDSAAKSKLYAPALEGYAGGWRIDTTDRGTTRAHHSGGVKGYACQYTRYLGADDAVIVILSNGQSNIHAIDRAIDAVLFEPPAMTLVVDASPYELTRYKAAELPSRIRFTVESSKSGVEIRLEDPEKDHVAARVRVPRGPARKLARDLETMLRGRAEGGEETEAGLYLGPYELAGGKLEIEDGLALRLMPRYVGRGENGERIVDERLTLVVMDSIRRQWPVMAKLGNDTARALSKALETALD